jgi:hypothetical protein
MLDDRGVRRTIQGILFEPARDSSPEDRVALSTDITDLLRSRERAMPRPPISCFRSCTTGWATSRTGGSSPSPTALWTLEDAAWLADDALETVTDS